MIEKDLEVRAARNLKYLFGNPSPKDRANIIQDIKVGKMLLSRHYRTVREMENHIRKLGRMLRG